MKSRRLLFFTLLLSLIAAFVFLKYQSLSFILPSTESPRVSLQTSSTDGPDISSRPFLILNDYQIFLEVADTDKERKQGLSDHPPLAENEGMLFVFDQPGNHGFWMKEMLFPLDFVYLNGETVVDLVENVPAPQPGQTPATVNAKSPFDKVLEVNAGLIAKIGVKAGDKATFND